VIWLGFGLASKLAMAALIIFFPVSTNFLDGLRRTDENLVDLARLHGASRRDLLLLIRVPSALPALCSGLRIAAANAPIGAIIGEWVGSSAGLGLMMLHANARMQTDTVFAGLAVLVAFSIALWAAVGALTRRLVAWAPETL
jgi:putative hydroxymethylpyrimidine transport system permease protein